MPILQHGLYGFVNTRTWKLAIQPAYRRAGRFSEGLAPVELASGESVFIDVTGKVALRGTFRVHLPDPDAEFSQGLAAVDSDRGTVYINPWTAGA